MWRQVSMSFILDLVCSGKTVSQYQLLETLILTFCGTSELTRWSSSCLTPKTVIAVESTRRVTSISIGSDVLGLHILLCVIYKLALSQKFEKVKMWNYYAFNMVVAKKSIQVAEFTRSKFWLWKNAFLKAASQQTHQS